MIEREQTSQSPDIFRQNADTLCELIQDGASAYYYRLTCSPDDPNEIVKIETMDAKPTGARRQEVDGQFNQAQFIATFTDKATDQQTQQYLWMRTGLRSTGTRITPHIPSLEYDYGFNELLPESIFGELVARAETVEHYSLIVDKMHELDIESLPSVTSGLHRMAFRLLTEEKMLLTSEEDVASLRKLIASVDKLDSNLTEQMQGRITTRLMNAFSSKDGRSREPNNVPTQDTERDAYAHLIEWALADGILPSETHIHTKILYRPQIFRYKFATDVLRHELENGYDSRGTRKTLFYIPRLVFVSNYMREIIIGQTLNQSTTRDNIIQYYISATADTGKSDKLPNFGPLRYLAESTGMVQAKDADSEDNTSKKVLSEKAKTLQKTKQEKREIALLPKTFQHVLDYIASFSENPDIEFHQKCVAIVEELTQPTLISLTKKIGKKALEQES